MNARAQAGAVVWFTGPPASGKSTLARAVRARLFARGTACALFDGDEVRAALVPRPGYSPDDRGSFYETLNNLAALLARQDLVVLVAATAHRRRYRDAARQRSRRFVEVYLRASREECAQRDEKGLYARARTGEIQGLPGADLDYEPPERPEVIASGGEDAQAVEQVVDCLDRLTRAGP